MEDKKLQDLKNYVLEHSWKEYSSSLVLFLIQIIENINKENKNDT